MASFKQGDKVRIKGQPSSPFYGKIGIVVRSTVYGLAVMYDVAFDQFMAHISPANKFFEYDLESAISN